MQTVREAKLGTGMRMPPHDDTTYQLLKILRVTISEAQSILASLGPNGTVAAWTLRELISQELFELLMRSRYFQKHGSNLKIWRSTLFQVTTEEQIPTDERLTTIIPDGRGQVSQTQWIEDLCNQIEDLVPTPTFTIPSRTESPIENEPPPVPPEPQTWYVTCLHVKHSEAVALRKCLELSRMRVLNDAKTVRRMVGKEFYTVMETLGFLEGIEDRKGLQITHGIPQNTQVVIVFPPMQPPIQRTQHSIPTPHKWPGFERAFEITFLEATNQYTEFARMREEAAKTTEISSSPRVICWAVRLTVPEAYAISTAYKQHGLLPIPNPGTVFGDRLLQCLAEEEYLRIDAAGQVSFNEELLSCSKFEIDTEFHHMIYFRCRALKKNEQTAKRWHQLLEGSINGILGSIERGAKRASTAKVSSTLYVTLQEAKSLIRLLELCPFTRTEFDSTLQPNLWAVLHEHGYVNSPNGQSFVFKFMKTRFVVVCGNMDINPTKRLVPYDGPPQEVNSSWWHEQLREQIARATQGTLTPSDS